MVIQRKTLITALMALAGLGFLSAVFVLYRGIGQFNQAGKVLSASMQKLNGFYDRNPFPSDANISQAQQDRKMLGEEFVKLLARLREGQVEREEKSPSKFMAMFWNAKNSLKEGARTNGVAIPDPENFPFGFAKYAGGLLPDPEDVPRLAQQLEIVERLCKILYEAKIEQLTAIERQEFEGGKGADREVSDSDEPGRATAGARVARVGRAAAATRRKARSLADKSAGLLKEGALYAKYHFVVEFNAKESVLADVLNRLASDKMCIAVTGMGIENEASAVILASTNTTLRAQRAEGKKVFAEDIPPREARVACGKESPLFVVMDMDVYRFVEAQPEKKERQE